MEEITVVRFFMDKEKRGKEKRRAQWQYYVDSTKIKTEAGSMKLITVYLPGGAYKKKAWTPKMWTEYLQGLALPPEGRYVYYLYEDGAGEILRRENEALPLEFVFFLIKSCKLRFEALVLLWDRETEGGDMLKAYVRNTRYMGVITDKAEYVAQWQDIFWEEYGFLLEVVGEAGALHVPRNGKKLIVAGKELYGLTPRMLLPGTVFISTETNGAGKTVCARAKDVKYIDIKCFLEGLLP